MMIVDAHLDLSYNAVRGRAVLEAAERQLPDGQGVPSVGLPNLKAGGVGLICATIFCEPADEKYEGYRTPDEARAAGLRQLQWYRDQEARGHFTFVRRSADVPEEPGDVLAAILLLEGADAIRGPDDVPEWFDAGLRIVGLAWHGTRYAGGTGEPGPITPAGRELLPALDRHGIIHDLSHLAEESFWQLLDQSGGAVMASHSNCREIVPTDRQLSDDMIRAIARRSGVIGINFFDKFLIPPAQRGTRRATLEDVTNHLRHMCDVIGDARHVGLGTDMDGGLGRDEIPKEIRTSADLPRVAEAISSAGFSDAEVRGVMAGNWVEFFRGALPGG
jgi:membrane dipeptidase